MRKLLTVLRSFTGTVFSEGVATPGQLKLFNTKADDPCAGAGITAKEWQTTNSVLELKSKLSLRKISSIGSTNSIERVEPLSSSSLA